MLHHQTQKLRGRLDPILKPFWNVRNKLSIFKDHLIIMNDRLVTPSSIQSQILQNLHIAHQGVKGMTNRAHQEVYWPGLDDGIKTSWYTCT